MSFLPPEEVKIGYSAYQKLVSENKNLQNELKNAKKQLALYGVVKRTLNRKIAAYKLVNMWFAKEYDSSTPKDEVESMEKEAAELNAQIKVLRYIDSTVKMT